MLNQTTNWGQQRPVFARAGLGGGNRFGVWAPGHALGTPTSLGATDNFFLDWPALSFIGNTAIAAGAGFVIPKTEGWLNTVAWVVLVVAGLRALNDFSKLRR